MGIAPLFKFVLQTELGQIYLCILGSFRVEAFRGAVSMAVSLYFGMLDSKPFRHIGETAKAANRGMSAESTLYFDYHE